MANEVGNIGPDGFLAAKLKACEAAIAQVPPEKPLRICGAMAQLAGKVSLVHWFPLTLALSHGGEREVGFSLPRRACLPRAWVEGPAAYYAVQPPRRVLCMISVSVSLMRNRTMSHSQ